MPTHIEIKGARVHNLKDVSVSIPREKLVVLTGISGSGKSSLAFDTIYAEGQRRYVESLSSYARQFLGVLDKPDVDSIEGLSPTIVIDQRGGSHNPRSTVGTMTEIYDYLRLMYSRIGVPHDPKTGKEVKKQTLGEIIEKLADLTNEGQVRLVVPLVHEKKGTHKRALDEIQKAEYAQVRINGNFYAPEDIMGIDLDKNKVWTIEVVMPQILPQGATQEQLEDLVKEVLDLGNGFFTGMVIGSEPEKEVLFSQFYLFSDGDTFLPEIEPRLFSFNSPHGACKACSGLGTRLVVDESLVIPNDKLTISEGAIRPWTRVYANSSAIMKKTGEGIKPLKFNLDTAITKLSPAQRKGLLYGCKEYVGIIPDLETKHKNTDSDYVRKEIEKYMRIMVCPTCEGKRLQEVVLAITVTDKSIADLVEMNVAQLKQFFSKLKPGKNGGNLPKAAFKIMEQLIGEVVDRLGYLEDVGLQYLTMDRSAVTLSGGELQRIRLATQIGTKLTGVVYVLDEPSIGLHSRDNEKLIHTMHRLRDLGNTVIVVEHDEATMHAADHIIDMGPGAGEHGGKVVAKGTAKELMKNNKSLTGKYLSGKESIAKPKAYRKGNGKSITIHGAKAFNLKDVTVEIPLGKLVAITGVSGSGKSTLMTDILARALSQHFYRAKDHPAEHKKITGIEHIDKVITIDQSPIGRTPRSNPATYTGVFTYIRDLFTEQPESKLKGFKAGHFSFNVKGGRCEACQGDGQVKIEMQMLSDVYVTCTECQGRRYNKEALDVYYKGKNIADVLEMTVEEARRFFRETKVVFEKLSTLNDVGLGYLRLGQPATTLSGGEAQRIKLATELSRRSTGKTLYILDEPTTGLHFEDIKRLLQVLNKLVDRGNTVLIIEHSMDVIKNVDWILDMGPDGGDKGGELVAAGTPPEVAKVKKSFTGKYLKEVI
jgi:excinuclease ABC subunit A